MRKLRRADELAAEAKTGERSLANVVCRRRRCTTGVAPTATAGRTYYLHKRTSGRTTTKQMRCLKRRLSDVVYRQLLDDATARLDTERRHSAGRNPDDRQFQGAIRRTYLMRQRSFSAQDLLQRIDDRRAECSHVCRRNVCRIFVHDDITDY